MFKKEKDRLAQLELEVNQLRHKLRLATEPDDSNNFTRNGWYYVTGELFITDTEIAVRDREGNLLVKRALPEGKTIAGGVTINGLLIGWKMGIDPFE